MNLKQRFRSNNDTKQPIRESRVSKNQSEKDQVLGSINSESRSHRSQIANKGNHELKTANQGSRGILITSATTDVWNTLDLSLRE